MAHYDDGDQSADVTATTLMSAEHDNARAIGHAEAAVNEQKQIALLFVDNTSAVQLSPVLDLLRLHKIPAAFVGTNDELTVKVNSL